MKSTKAKSNQSRVVPLRPHNLAHIKRDRGYRWAAQDEDMIELCAAITKTNLSSTQISQRVAELSHGAYRPTPATIDKWMNGTTKRPQNFVLRWVGSAIGKERVWRDVGG